MRSVALLALPVLLVAAGCGPKTLVLPEDPVERAATCGVIEAATAREKIGVPVGKPLPVEAQGRILHYALLAASAGGSYEASTAVAVVKQQTEMADRVTAGKWQALQAPCAAAFPAVDKSPTSLPGDAMTATLGCDELATFMRTALARQSYAFDDTLEDYRTLNRVLDQPSAVLFVRRGIMKLPARLAERNKALARIVQLGSPVPMLKLCIARYG